MSMRLVAGARCKPCKEHQHQRCHAYLATLGFTVVAPGAACACGCRIDPASPYLTREAVEDMAAHGTLVGFVLDRQAGETSSLNWHFGTPCRRCADQKTYAHGTQESLF